MCEGQPCEGFVTFARFRREQVVVYLAGHYYHVYNRGCNRELIFCGEGNYEFLLRQAKKILADGAVAFIAYCLMPNHYHMLLRSEQDGAVSQFLQRLFNSYTQAFNRQQSRTGTLFEGRAKSIFIDDERYLIHLCRYIHLNPVVAGLVEKAENWPYSNYPEWIGARAGTLVDRDLVRSYFPNTDRYRAFIEESIEESMAKSLTKYCGD